MKVSGVQQPATEWLQRQQQASAQLARVFLDDETLTPTASGFSMTSDGQQKLLPFMMEVPPRFLL